MKFDLNKLDTDIYYRCSNLETVFEMRVEQGAIRGVRRHREHDSLFCYYREIKNDEMYMRHIEMLRKTPTDGILSMDNFYKRVCKYCAGMTIEEADKFIEENPELFWQKKEVIKTMEKGFLVGIHDVDIRREFGNDKKNTFEFVKVEVMLKMMPDAEKIKMVKENRDVIVEFAKKELASKKKYTKYGVPVDYLRPYAWALGKNAVYIDFELKS